MEAGSYSQANLDTLQTVSEIERQYKEILAKHKPKERCKTIAQKWEMVSHYKEEQV